MKKKIIKFILAIILIITLFIFYSYYVTTKNIKTKEYSINVNIDKNYYGLKIVHFGDIHYNGDLEYLKKMVNLINKSKPDIVIFSGDLIDKDKELDSDEMDEIINILNEINANLGKYSIKGDEDDKYYENIMKKANFTLLDNSYEYIYSSENPIIISNTNIDVDSILNILVIHKPDDILNYNYSNFDLVLAGHSNNQINIPLIKNLFLKNGSKKYYNEYYQLGNTQLFITNGIGTSNINIRINSNPSINLYRIR